MFAKFEENPAMTLQDIKKTKCYGRTDGQTHTRTHARTHGQRENSKPTTNKVCGGYNKPTTNKVCGGYNYRLCRSAVGLSVALIGLTRPNCFMSLDIDYSLFQTPAVKESYCIFHNFIANKITKCGIFGFYD